MCQETILLPTVVPDERELERTTTHPHAGTCRQCKGKNSSHGFIVLRSGFRSTESVVIALRPSAPPLSCTDLHCFRFSPQSKSENLSYGGNKRMVYLLYKTVHFRLNASVWGWRVGTLDIYPDTVYRTSVGSVQEIRRRIVKLVDYRLYELLN